MTYRLYLDTSVLGAIFDREDPDRIQLTRAVLERFRRAPYQAFIGIPVLEEIARAPERLRKEMEREVAALSPTVVEEGPPAIRLADAYLSAGLVSPQKRNDARHLALASVSDLDAVVSWNFRDMVNIEKKTIVHAVNVKFGYRLIDIISPLEVPLE